MKILTSIALLAISITLSNCTPARIVADNHGPDTKTAKVKISREDTLLFVGVPAIFGYDEQDKVSLWKGGNAQMNVPVGKHEFFVRSNQADKPFKSSIEVKESESLCLIIHPEIKPVAKIIIPFVYYFFNAFSLEKAKSCE